MNPKPWRSCPLISNKYYIVTETKETLLGTLKKGDLIIFESLEYSRYDNMSIFLFRVSSDVNGYVKFSLFDNEPDPEWDSFIKPYDISED